ncbi:hypothetical protein H9L39_20019 [Fusarium oxysporum f. sp. albedinis]|nr:hypothetical protein H9L39_20019 [Fusarium oxysporum f. sp. albedinis]
MRPKSEALGDLDVNCTDQRNSSYPTWGTPPAPVPMSHVPISGTESYLAATMGSLAGTASFTTESQGLPIQSSMKLPVPLYGDQRFGAPTDPVPVHLYADDDCSSTAIDTHDSAQQS